MFIKFKLFLVCISLVLPAYSCGNGITGYGNIQGTIGMSSNSTATNISVNKQVKHVNVSTLNLESLEITISKTGASFSTIPDVNGNFSFTDVPAGDYNLSISQSEAVTDLTYETESIAVTVTADETLELTVPSLRSILLEDYFETNTELNFIHVDSEDNQVILAVDNDKAVFVDDSNKENPVINSIEITGEAFAYNDATNILYTVNIPYIRLYNEIGLYSEINLGTASEVENLVWDFAIDTNNNYIYLIIGSLEGERSIYIVSNENLVTTLDIGTTPAFIEYSNVTNTAFIIDEENIIYLIDGDALTEKSNVSFEYTGVETGVTSRNRKIALNPAQGILYMVYVDAGVRFIAVDSDANVLVNGLMEDVIPFEVVGESGSRNMYTGKSKNKEIYTAPEDTPFYYDTCEFPNIDVNLSGANLFINGYPFQIQENSFVQPEYNITNGSGCETPTDDAYLRVAFEESSISYRDIIMENYHSSILDMENMYLYVGTYYQISRYTRDGNDIDVTISFFIDGQDLLELRGLAINNASGAVYTYNPNNLSLLILE